MLAGFVIICVVFLALGLPLFVALGFSGLIYLLLEGITPAIAIQNMFAGLDKTSLLAIPFFILAGDLMNRGGLAKRLVRMAYSFIGNIHGGLAITGVVCSMFFAAVSGSGPATAAAIGSVMIPAMTSNGYDKNYAATVIAAASPMGIIIPPSIAFVVYSTLTGSAAKISDLYKAGFSAGVLMGGMLMLVAYLTSRKRGYKGNDQMMDKESRKKEMLFATGDALWALGMPVIIIGGVFGGVFTPTESAVVASIYALVVGLVVYRDIRLRDLPKIFLESAKSTTSIMLIMSNAAIFAYVLTYERVPQKILEAITSMSIDKHLMLFLLNLLLLFLGCILESSVIQNITVPILMPVLMAMEVDLVHFGMIMTCNLAIGMLTPPFGICLFTAARTGNVTIQGISRECWPFLLAMIGCVLLITYFPQIVLFAVQT